MLELQYSPRNVLCNSEPLKYLITSCQSGGLSYLPKLGFNFPLKIFRAVLFPIPLEPTKPRTWPGRGVGKRWSLKLLAEYLCVTCDSRLVGRLMILIAPNGHFFGQIPQPMQRFSEMKAILDVASTSIQRRPLRTTGQDFLHSCRHFYTKWSVSTINLLERSGMLTFGLHWVTGVLLAFRLVRGGVVGHGLKWFLSHLVWTDDGDTVRIRAVSNRKARDKQKS